MGKLKLKNPPGAGVPPGFAAPEAYEGDAAMAGRLLSLGVATPLVLLRAKVMAAIFDSVWAPEPARLFQEMVGPREWRSLAEAQGFMSQSMAWWNSLCIHQEPGHPFRLLPYADLERLSEVTQRAYLRSLEIEPFHALAGLDESFTPKEVRELVPLAAALAQAQEGICKLVGALRPGSRPATVQKRLARLKELESQAEEAVNALGQWHVRRRRSGKTSGAEVG